MCKYTEICTYLHIWIYRNMYEEYMNMNVYIKLMKNMNTNLNKEYTNVHEYIKRTCMYIVHRNIQFVGYWLKDSWIKKDFNILLKQRKMPLFI